jgi:tRNA threonylcarbamoyladenosine biosynthesis protein TsaB
LNPSLVLGIETSGTSTGLALAARGKVVAELVENSTCGHNEVLLPLLDRLLESADVTVRDIAGVGVDIGPGMFTSLRVGTSTAKGLALARRVPVVGVGALWSLARTARPTLDGVLAVVDARKHQVYAALYLDRRQTIPPSVLSPTRLLSEVGAVVPQLAKLVVAGSGAAVCAAGLTAAGIEHEPSGVETPSPGVIAAEASERIAQGEVDPIASLEPLYLRRTDAELTREQKLNPKL